MVSGGHIMRCEESLRAICTGCGRKYRTSGQKVVVYEKINQKRVCGIKSDHSGFNFEWLRVYASRSWLGVRSLLYTMSTRLLRVVKFKKAEGVVTSPRR